MAVTLVSQQLISGSTEAPSRLRVSDEVSQFSPASPKPCASSATGTMAGSMRPSGCSSAWEIEPYARGPKSWEQLLGPHIPTHSHELWLLGGKVSQHISVQKLLLPMSRLPVS